jgi:cytochrome c
MKRRWAILSCILSIALSGCEDKAEQTARALTGGDPKRGRVAMDYYGCASCHTVPGLPGADGLVGPNLGQVGSRAYIGGVLQNTPRNLIRWIQDPPAVDSLTAMPKLNIPSSDARDIASFLYTLK